MSRTSTWTTPSEIAESMNTGASSTEYRPWTAQSTRAGTARPTTAASTVRQDGTYVIAVLEGRGVAREVGMAALDKDTGKAILSQVRIGKKLVSKHLHP